MINQELVRKARQTDLVAYLMNRVEPLKRVGANYITNSKIYAGNKKIKGINFIE